MSALWSLQGLSLKELAIRTCRRSWRDEVFGQASRLAFYLFFALFPVMLLLILVAKPFGCGTLLRDALTRLLRDILPKDAAGMIAKVIRELNDRATIGGGAIAAGLGAVWGALNGTWAIITGLNKAYEVDEKRTWQRVVLIACGLTVGLTALGLLALAAALLGGRVEFLAGHFRPAWQAIQWIITALLLFCSFSVIYRFGPNLKDRRWQWSLPGSVVAVVLWTAFALLLRLYEDHSKTSHRVFGDVSAVATLLFWLYLTAAAIFIGGEVNSEIEKSSAEQGHSDARSAVESRSGQVSSSL